MIIILNVHLERINDDDDYDVMTRGDVITGARNVLLKYDIIMRIRGHPPFQV